MSQERGGMSQERGGMSQETGVCHKREVVCHKRQVYVTRDRCVSQETGVCHKRQVCVTRAVCYYNRWVVCHNIQYATRRYHKKYSNMAMSSYYLPSDFHFIHIIHCKCVHDRISIFFKDLTAN